MGGFEKKPNASKMLKTKLCQELEIKPLWTLLFPASVTDDYTDRFCTPYFLDGFGTFQLYRELIHLFHGNSQRQLAIKFKPRDSLMELTQNLISSLAPGHAMIFTKNLHWLLNACDAVFIYHSNVGLEALFYDIPILQYHKPGQLTNSPLVHSGAAIQVEHIGDLPALMDRLKGDENFRMERISAQRKFLKDNLPDDGRSAVERIVEIIDHIAQNTLSKAH